jgi:hypothetical protein
VQAALAYDLKAIEMLGRDAKLNFSEGVRDKLQGLLDQGVDMSPLDHPDVLERLAGGDSSAVDQVAAGMVDEQYYMPAPMAPPHLPGPMVVPHGLSVGGRRVTAVLLCCQCAGCSAVQCSAVQCSIPHCCASHLPLLV